MLTRLQRLTQADQIYPVRRCDDVLQPQLQRFDKCRCAAGVN